MLISKDTQLNTHTRFSLQQARRVFWMVCSPLLEAGDDGTVGSEAHTLMGAPEAVPAPSPAKAKPAKAAAARPAKSKPQPRKRKNAKEVVELLDDEPEPEAPPRRCCFCKELNFKDYTAKVIHLAEAVFGFGP